jgi:hypothetical protein
LAFNSENMNPAYIETRFIGIRKIRKLPKECFVITAYNPMDQKLPEAENKMRNQMLKQKIILQKKICLEITGTSEDLSHQEPSFLTDANLKQSLAWANEFQQRAIFSIKNNQLSIISCSEDERTIELGDFLGRCL